MGYFDAKKSSSNSSSQKEPLLPLFEQSMNFTTSYLIPRSTLRQRERFILILIILCFIIFSIGGVFFLPELKAGKQFAYKHIEKAGSDFIGKSHPTTRTTFWLFFYRFSFKLLWLLLRSKFVWAASPNEQLALWNSFAYWSPRLTNL